MTRRASLAHIAHVRQTAEPVVTLLEGQVWAALRALAPLLISTKQAAQMEARDQEWAGLVNHLKRLRKALTLKYRTSLIQALHSHGLLSPAGRGLNLNPEMDKINPLGTLPLSRINEFAHACADAESMMWGMVAERGRADPDQILRDLEQVGHAPDVLVLLDQEGQSPREFRLRCLFARPGNMRILPWVVGDTFGPYHVRVAEPCTYALVTYRVVALHWGVPRWELSSSVAKDQNEEPLVLTTEQEQEARRILMRVLSWDRPGLPPT